jgi:hypothetical protein
VAERITATRRELLVFGGLVLRDGNLSGRFVTFPFAGGLTITVGIFLLVIGLVLTVVPFMNGDRTSTKAD